MNIDIASIPISQRLTDLHRRIQQNYPHVVRIGCAVYDETTGQLSPLINSTLVGEPIEGYSAFLADSLSLSTLAKEGKARVIDDIPAQITPNSAHSQWVLDQGYLSSLTFPMYARGSFIGFVFYDADRLAYFQEPVISTLHLYFEIIEAMIAVELSRAQTIAATVRVAQDFAKLRDFETGAHVMRVAHFSKLIAQKNIEAFGLNDEYVNQLLMMAPMHDLGKIGVRDRILLKPGRLTPEEREEMKKHVDFGLNLIADIFRDIGLKDDSAEKLASEVIGHHHEMLDGSGYPLGLKGDDVSVAGRIVATADIFDALVSPRPYKAGWSFADALAELNGMVDRGKLDARCVSALANNLGEVERIMTAFSDDFTSAEAQG